MMGNLRRSPYITALATNLLRFTICSIGCGAMYFPPAVLSSSFLRPALSPHRALCLSARGARTFRQAAALSPRTARTAGAAARARSRHAHRRRVDDESDLRRRHAGASGKGARAARPLTLLNLK